MIAWYASIMEYDQLCKTLVKIAVSPNTGPMETAVFAALVASSNSKSEVKNLTKQQIRSLIERQETDSHQKFQVSIHAVRKAVGILEDLGYVEVKLRARKPSAYKLLPSS